MPINRKDYPEDWEELKKQVLLRAKNKCALCGKENYSLSDRGTKEKWKKTFTVLKFQIGETIKGENTMIIQEDPKFQIGETVKLIGTNHLGTVISSHYNVTRLMCFWTYKVAIARSGGVGEWIETDCEKIE